MIARINTTSEPQATTLADPGFGRERIQRLRERMNGAAHSGHRMALPLAWCVDELPLSLAGRRAEGLKLLCERMPVVIEEDELIVGMRTVAAQDQFGRFHCSGFPRFKTGDCLLYTSPSPRD